ncbi:MAG: lactate dehydrogenase [Alphaproteobacteria bacterium]|nr:lactate dehydrogenase [Alphaproteobacteria bacterium]
MNAVEIEEAISNLAEQPFDPAEFPFLFLEAFDNKETTLKRLRKGDTNKSDLGGVLQANNIHIVVAPPGEVTNTFAALKASPATARWKAKFVVATDGDSFEGEELASGEGVVCRYADFPNHFGLFLGLANITTVKAIRDSAFDIRATRHLNRLYVELLKDNPEWGQERRRADMNHFMARLIFCFFAEDTEVFSKPGLFTSTVEQMSAPDSSNTHQVIGTLFQAMNTKYPDRVGVRTPRWADPFAYVNGGLFSGSMDVPRFSKIARSYLLRVGGLDWKKINPDIFGSMIQAITEEEERGALGMHYTSVPNILKVLNPLFLDDLRRQLEEAGGNRRKLLNLRHRMARIRVFDPACGSGNFLVIAYKAMREIEAEVNRRRGETDKRSEIPKTNFRGIELRNFAAEIARLSLVIAEFQCDVLHIGQKKAMEYFLPLEAENWITCGNALRLDWLRICPPTGTSVERQADDLFRAPHDQAGVDFENGGGETYICGNPPYLGFTWQSMEQKSELEAIFGKATKAWKSLDYVAGWFQKAALYGQHTNASAAFVSTNSICQGEQVPILWPLIFESGHEITFAHTSFKWANLASHNAGVTVAIVAISNHAAKTRRLFSTNDDGKVVVREASNINAYLASGSNVIVKGASRPSAESATMVWGNKPTDGGHLCISSAERRELLIEAPEAEVFVRRYVGSQEIIRGEQRYCIWVEDADKERAGSIAPLAGRFAKVREMRERSVAASTRTFAALPFRFRQIQAIGTKTTIAIPSVSSERRPYLPVDLFPERTIVSNLAFAIYDAPLWNMALIASRLHLVWIATVCGKLKTDFRYSNTLGWNTFPVPMLTEKQKADLTRCAEDILLTREAHFPATIADLYDPDNMPSDLSEAHERNDEVVERIFIGRRFRNDTERLEKLFDFYTRMTSVAGQSKEKEGAKERG